MTADIIRFPRRNGDEPACKDVTLDAYAQAIQNIMADLAYPSRLILLTGVVLEFLRSYSGDRLDQDRMAKAFARGLYVKISK